MTCQECGKVTFILDICRQCNLKREAKLVEKKRYGSNIPGNCRICGAPRERCAC